MNVAIPHVKLAGLTKVAASLSDAPSTRKLIFPWAERSPLHLFYWYEVTLPGLVKRLRPNVLFSQTNYLPHRPLECPTLLLEHPYRQFEESRISIW